MILMSNNQWKCDLNTPAWAERGEDCSAESRVKGLVRSYQEIMPDVLGIQEASVRMNELVMREMTRFEHKGQSAHYELITGGDTPILYRDDKLLLIESGFFRYSERVPGYEGSFNNAGTKSYTYGVFEDRGSKRLFAVMTTHLWWKSSNPSNSDYQAHSDEARVYQIRLALRRLEEVMATYACPGFLMGDLNATVQSPCLDAAKELGWIDAHDAAQGKRDETRGHHPCGPAGYRRAEKGTFSQAIDHILTKTGAPVQIGDYLRIDEPWFDCISDHYPLYLTFEFTEVPR